MHAEIPLENQIMAKKSKRTPSKQAGKRTGESGRLRIGDHWNAINIIALSQSSPLKAVAEFVENSIDARSKKITIVRGREQGQPFLRVIDDGLGVPKDNDGLPDFKYVATHVCDSIKRRMREGGQQGIQGEFGIGLLSFWTVGEELSLVCSGANGKTYEMKMAKGDPNYTVTPKRRLLAVEGTQLTVKPLLSGIRHFSGEKLQWYLASELRDRIRTSGVQIRIVDRQARAEFIVEPRQFSGQLLHRLPKVSTSSGEVYAELYLDEPGPENQIGLYRSGTRVLRSLTEIDDFQRPPWTSGYLQGIIDAPFLSLTPGTRMGIVRDAAFAELCQSLGPLEESLTEIVEAQQKAEEERTNRQTLRSIQKAFREALLVLPEEDYDWFPAHRDAAGSRKRPTPEHAGYPLKVAEANDESTVVTETTDAPPVQKEFFEHAGPLYSVRISPASCVVPVGKSKNLRAVSRDRSGRQVEDDLGFCWEVIEGTGSLEKTDGEIVTFTAPEEPGLTKIRVMVAQEEIACTAEALITVTDSLLPDKKESRQQQGLPGYTFRNAPGELWRSRYDTEKNVIVINKGHRDFVYASRTKALQLRYMCRLFAKELVCRNFPGYSTDELLERMIELSLYTEEHLR